jgi:hypothetical protein
MEGDGRLAHSIPARLTAAEGRKFGATVGLAFVALAAVLWWRDHLLASRIAGGLGGALLVAALLVPSRLGVVQRGWMAFGLALSKITSPIFMSIVYIIVLTPIGILRRTIGRNPLVPVAGPDGSVWVERQPNLPKQMERLF